MQNMGIIPDLRVAAFSTHLGGVIIAGLALICSVVLLAIWLRAEAVSNAYREMRMALGAFLLISGLLEQVAILLFHVEQFEDKWGKSSSLPYGFNNWDEAQKTTTRITFGWSYALLWVSTILTFISGWIMLGSTCCWTREYVDTETSDISFSLPRLDRLSKDSD
ncbi:hypothetical protein FGIG_10825 [Fasciola gigantica]|uniref:Uncharacterized protein n=1 Tax=Fasciola gigantica TaxID=46835 RepID=A0A504YJ76_FASGI|nr:hypothetical protein FGIG_10825 [Fasciola gigantica]